MAGPGKKSDNEKLVLSRLKKETGIDEDVIQQNINKILPIGQSEDGKQRRIVNLLMTASRKNHTLKNKKNCCKIKITKEN